MPVYPSWMLGSEWVPQPLGKYLVGQLGLEVVATGWYLPGGWCPMVPLRVCPGACGAGDKSTCMRVELLPSQWEEMASGALMQLGQEQRAALF